MCCCGLSIQVRMRILGRSRHVMEISSPGGLIPPLCNAPFLANPESSSVLMSGHMHSAVIGKSLFKDRFCNLSVHHWMNGQRRCGTYIMEYYSAIKRNEIGSFVEMWMDLETVIQSEVSQKEKNRASLVAQWLRICLPMQGTRVRALVREDPTCCRATRPVRHNY